MEFISGESREQTLLPERVEDYVDDNNAVRVIDAYINSLNMAELGFSKTEPGNTGRPPYNPPRPVKTVRVRIHEPDTLVAAAGKGEQAEP